MARKTQGKPDDQEQSAAPQSDGDGVDSAQQEGSPAASQDAAQSMGDGGDPPPGSDQEDPAPTPPQDASADQSQGGVDLNAGEAPAPSSAQAELDAQHDDQDSDPENAELLMTFEVTDRTDVLHDGEWYYEGDPIVLNEKDAESLFKNGCIMWPKDDAK